MEIKQYEINFVNRSNMNIVAKNIYPRALLKFNFKVLVEV